MSQLSISSDALNTVIPLVAGLIGAELKAAWTEDRISLSTHDKSSAFMSKQSAQIHRDNAHELESLLKDLRNALDSAGKGFAQHVNLADADIANVIESLEDDIARIGNRLPPTNKPLREYYREELEYAAHWLSEYANGEYHIVVTTDADARVVWHVARNA